MLHTRHEAAKSSPIWQPPDLEVWASSKRQEFQRGGKLFGSQDFGA